MAGALCVSVQMVVDAEHDRRSLGARGRALREEAVVLRAADKAEGRHARDAVSRPDGNGRRVGKAQLSGVERLAALLSDTPAVVKTVAVDGFVEHGAPALLRARLGLDGPGIAGFCMRECKL